MILFQLTERKKGSEKNDPTHSVLNMYHRGQDPMWGSRRKYKIRERCVTILRIQQRPGLKRGVDHSSAQRNITTLQKFRHPYLSTSVPESMNPCKTIIRKTQKPGWATHRRNCPAGAAAVIAPPPPRLTELRLMVRKRE
ncbi:hypothetical protein NPIL_388251 [Nephila pilipes]|uniref:Uncharacterized protein n=1 Tax=Nephila pilipes TaxID=299642 RepID=A0A8X6Q6U1_NEPPI|nr:hypothetical protein NPIL_388251 [Nephila pilipes]